MYNDDTSWIGIAFENENAHAPNQQQKMVYTRQLCKIDIYMS